MRPGLVLAAVLGLLATLGACGDREASKEGASKEAARLPPAMGALRRGVETQMTALLRDIATAQERAQVDRGRYVNWDELRQSYYPDPLPPNLRVRMVLLGEQAYEVEVSHEPSGIRCGMSKGTTASLYGAPRCR
jgi:hypothetical protein